MGDLPQQRKDFCVAKRSKDVTHLTSEEFSKALYGETFIPTSQVIDERRSTLKNQVNRLTGTTGEEGQLYEFEEYHWSEVSIYMKVEQGFEERVQSLLRYVAATGYGKRKSAGYGQVELVSFGLFGGFPLPPDANGFVSLSNFVPAANDPKQGSWQVLVKYGKMGEEYALGGNPFKRPLLMFRAGSTFYDSPCREYYGRLVQDISSTYPQAVQYAFALPVPMRLPPT
jgi:CRISPR-associated protein Csm4